MSSAAQSSEPLTLERVYRELESLRQRVEDLEDLRDLEKAIAENAGKPLIARDEAKEQHEFVAAIEKKGGTDVTKKFGPEWVFGLYAHDELQWCRAVYESVEGGAAGSI